MRLIDRYILTDFARNFIISLLAVTMMLFVAEYLRGVWDENIAPFTLLKYNAFMIPSVMAQMVAPASMLGTAITLSLLNRKNELTAMQASGISIVHISALIFGAIFIACCFTLILHDRIAPPLARARTSFYYRVIKNRPDFSMDIKTSKIWYRSKNNIYNLQTFDKSTNTIHGIGIYFFNNRFQLAQHVEAKSAKFDPEKGEWILGDGMLTIFPESSTFPLSKHFEAKRVTLPESPKDFMEIEKQVDTLRLRDLHSFIQRNKEAGLNTSAYEVDFHSRIGMSFIPLIMGLLAIPYSIRQRRQGGLGRDLSVCLAWIFSYWLLFSISLSLGKSGAVAALLAVWGPSAVFLVIAVLLVLRHRTV